MICEIFDVTVFVLCLEAHTLGWTGGEQSKQYKIDLLISLRADSRNWPPILMIGSHDVHTRAVESAMLHLNRSS